jgi:methylated-DNA-[protein]-cysteine S-methyltransferase
MKTYYSTTPSPIGELLLTGNGTALTGLYMQVHKHGREISADWSRNEAAFKPARAQLAAYFAGELRRFELRVEMAGTAFQQRVWRALRDIPHGATESYGALANRIGAPKAARAVGLANGRNPISIIVPCHRVIGANGSLTGYGGGIERKQWLLAHELPADQRAALAG